VFRLQRPRVAVPGPRLLPLQVLRLPLREVVKALLLQQPAVRLRHEAVKLRPVLLHFRAGLPPQPLRLVAELQLHWL